MNQSVLSVTWASSLTATLAPPPMFEEPCHAASLLRHLRRHVSSDCFRSLMTLLVYSRPEYGNFILVGLPASLQRRSLFGVSTSSLRPRDRCPRDASLVASSGTGQLQTDAHGISSPARYGTGVLESTRSGIIRPARSSPSTIVIYISAARPAVPSDNYWSSLVSYCSLHRLEYFAFPRPVITIYI